ncbi:MAG: hypothetical protein JXP73_06620, partial [Deltaproteobacteria bacterium]|nr:hypothetical protein [Deltaproteobacteria bacterium]
IISNAEPYQFPASGQVYVPLVQIPCADAAGAGPDALGPVCSQLARCCPTITDLPSVREQCEQSVGNAAGESGCGIALLDLQHLGYCLATGTGGALGTGGMGAGGMGGGAGGAGGKTGAGGAGGATGIPIADGGRDAPAVDGSDAAADAKGDVAGDAISGGPIPFALLVTQSPPGPANGDMTTWGGVLQFTVAGAGATLQPATGIPAALLHDPAGLAFRASSSEVFVANRHGNNSADGTAGSINRFKYDRATRSFAPNGAITGNGLSGVHSLAFNPVTGELFAANIAGGVSRFTFDAQGVAVAHGVIADGTTRGVFVSNDGTRLWVTTASTSVRAFDLSSGAELPSVALPSGACLHYFGTLNGIVYVGGLNDDLVHRLTVGAGNALTYKDAIPGHAPISIAFSPDGLEMFVGGHRDTDVIDRYKPAVTATGSTDGWAETTTFSTGSSLGAILIVP